MWSRVISCHWCRILWLLFYLETPWSSKPPEILLWRHQIQTTNTDCLKEAPAQISIRLGSRLLAWRTLKGQSWMQSLPASLEHSWRILTIQVCFRWVCATSFTFISESEKEKKIEKLTATIERWWKIDERNEKARSLHGSTVPSVIMCQVQSNFKGTPMTASTCYLSGSLRMEPRSLQVVKEYWILLPKHAKTVHSYSNTANLGKLAHTFTSSRF